MEEERKIEMGVRVENDFTDNLSKPMKISLLLTYICYVFAVGFILVGMFGSMLASMIIGTVLFILSSISLMAIVKINKRKNK